MNEKLPHEPERKESAPAQESVPESRRDALKNITARASEAYGAARRLLSGIRERLIPDKEKAERQRQLKEKLSSTIQSRDNVRLEYTPGLGVVSAIARENKERAKALKDERAGKVPNIQATGFKDCCGVVMQSKEGVSIVHISPRADLMAEQDAPYASEYLGHLNAALHGFTEAPQESEQRDFKILAPERTKVLSPEQRDQLQKNVRVTLVGGDKQLMERLAHTFASGDAEGSGVLLPRIEPSRLELGTGDKSIIANDQDLLVVDSATEEITDAATPSTQPERT